LRAPIINHHQMLVSLDGGIPQRDRHHVVGFAATSAAGEAVDVRFEMIAGRPSCLYASAICLTTVPGIFLLEVPTAVPAGAIGNWIQNEARGVGEGSRGESVVERGEL